MRCEDVCRSGTAVKRPTADGASIYRCVRALIDANRSCIARAFVWLFAEIQTFVEHIDAIDNGVDVADTPVKYDVSTHLSARVAALNPK